MLKIQLKRLLTSIKKNPLFYFLLSLFSAQLLVNFIALVSPEIGFDALWYHLTLPKLYLFQHRWYYPGGLLYYSLMPRLAEIIFTPLLYLFGTVGPKSVQFIAAILTSFVLYKFTRRYFKSTVSLLLAVLFYNSWVVSWQSTSAYIDLIVTFFELTAIYFLSVPKAPKKHQLLAGVFFGLAISTKLHALPHLFLAAIIFSPLILIPALLLYLPWAIIAFFYSGNPLYPLGEAFISAGQLSHVSPNYFSFFALCKRVLNFPFQLAFPPDDIINPIIALLFILGLFYLLKNKPQFSLKLFLYTAFSVAIWLLTPPPRVRYLLPTLPLLLLLSGFSFSIKRLSRILILLAIFSAIGITSLRFLANLKYWPYIIGQISQNQFLADYSYRLPDTFIDSDNWVQDNLTGSDQKVLVDKLHNLYYLPINFDHTSWANDSHYPYLITVNQDPDAIDGQLLHVNDLGIQVFQLN